MYLIYLISKGKKREARTVRIVTNKAYCLWLMLIMIRK